MEFSAAIATALFPKDGTNAQALYDVGSIPMGAGAGLVASHIVKTVMPINPLVSAVYGAVACFTSALFSPIIDKIFENVIKNSTAGKLVKLTINTLISFSIAWLTISFYGINIPLATALLTAGVICAVNSLFIFTILAQAESR